MKRLVIIDGHALVHRAFHALPLTLVSPKGVLINAVYGFTSLLLKTIKDLNPEYIVATFDLAGPTFRHEEFAEYKVHRQKAPDELHTQVPLIKEVLKAFGIPVYEKEGFEADDLIGAISEKYADDKDIQVIIMTGDLDTLQLVRDDKVVVWTSRKGLTDTVLYNEKEIEKRYGLRPDQLVDYRGLKGDPSDNIPGVPGIGEKTAIDLIKKFGSIEELYKSIASEKLKVKSRKSKKQDLSPKLVERLLENKDMAFFSKKLSTIITKIDFDFKFKDADWRTNLDEKEIERLFKDLGFYSLLKRFKETGPVRSSLAEVSLETRDKIASETSYGMEEIKVSELKTKKEIAELIGSAKAKREIAVFLHDKSLSFSFDEKEAFVLKDGGNLEILAEIMEDKEIRKICHDFKEIYKYLKSNISNLKSIKGMEFDSKLAAYLINSDLKDYSLEKIYYNDFGQIPGLDKRAYSAYLFRLEQSLKDKIKSLKLDYVLDKIEIPLSPVLAEMELIGVKINSKSIADLSKSLDRETSKIEKEIYKMAGEEFNISSPQQLGKILFEKLNLKTKVRKTGKGASSTAASELEKLSDEHPIIDLISRYRELQKLKTTYVEPFPELINKENGRLCTTFNQTGATTGRLSSQDPNLQNIPIRTKLGQEFRKAFISDNGYKLVSFDYSQIELRIAAHISKDKKMSEVFRRGEDIHTRTAAEIFGVSTDKITKDMRQTAKVLNFGLIYGMGPMAFQRAAKVSRSQAKEFISRYMSEFSGVARYMAETRVQARKNGYISTIFGRRKQLNEINSGILELARSAERMAINMPVQGTAADLIKLAMVEIYKQIHNDSQEDKVRLLLQVHDELLFEIKENLIEEWSGKIKKIMETAYSFDVPIVVDVKAGDNWAEMDEIATSN